MGPAFASAAAQVFLGPPGRQRLRASQSLLAYGVYLLCAALELGVVHLGLVDGEAIGWLLAATIPGPLIFYLVIRSGLNERLAADPSLSLLQTVFGITVTAFAYGQNGILRGGTMTLLAIILVFAMFSLSPRQSRALAVYAFVAVAAVSMWKTSSEPLLYPRWVELAHLAVEAIVLTAVAVLSGRMNTLRTRLKSQRQALAEALERISHLATRDELTGLVNRRHMNELMRAEHERQRRIVRTKPATPSMTIAVIDIDFFKRVNDRHGHQAGDLVLKTFADASRRVLRASDVLGRWGGEEFLLMLPATTPEQAIVTVERLREVLAATSFDQFEPGLRVTFSAGLCACEDRPLDEAIDRADQAMYSAKAKGRNCSVLAS